ncbi:hypothetical protein [Geminocystis sp. NIES-3709]|uniref:hypothetical protein n=1 Tax=Geminocystis sp. NIES-3709 TaxID=1617448 RepID=UPI0005FC79F5|nr:hypothetical protein [Geminocystis sp. NIES-3709]BAQ65080.1 hypothetical protein GM3709_1845 [Geminocystis sp. NIES-3709]
MKRTINDFKQGKYHNVEKTCLFVLKQKPNIIEFQNLLDETRQRLCQLTYRENPNQFSALITINIQKNQPIPIYFDEIPQFNICLFDFTGENYTPKFSHPISYYYSEKTEGKGHILQILSEKLPDNFAYYGFLDHDIFLCVSDINKMLFIADIFNLDLFQPSLSLDSYFSFSHLLHQPGYIIKESNFVETMMPFFSNYGYLKSKEFFYESISGWGIDYIFSHKLFEEKRKIAIVHDVIAAHKKPVSSTYWILSNGITPYEELDNIKNKYNLNNLTIF